MSRTGSIEELERAQPGTHDIMSVGEAARLAEIMKAIADPVRLRLPTWVADAPDTTHLPAVLGISQPILSHHLKRLVDAGPGKSRPLSRRSAPRSGRGTAHLLGVPMW